MSVDTLEAMIREYSQLVASSPPGTRFAYRALAEEWLARLGPGQREALADDLAETHDHELPIHDTWGDVFLGQADALIARGWARLSDQPDPDRDGAPFPAGVNRPDGRPEGLDVERLESALRAVWARPPDWLVDPNLNPGSLARADLAWRQLAEGIASAYLAAESKP